jgi:hypothetical protein
LLAVALAVGGGVLGGLAFDGSGVARACGGFFRRATVPAEERPSLSREKVLIIHDAARGEEHFVREVAFQRAREPFGFVVPTPSRPEVFKVKKTPFTKLRELFPYGPTDDGGRGKGLGGARSGGGAAGVEVLEVKKVGSFTAFVLSATDEKALAQWLADNELVSTPQADAWLSHYVKMGFFYVAMRYDPPKRARPSLAVEAETIRISFATPMPYYPYFEPTDPDIVPATRRLLELWYVGETPVIPVALREHEDGLREWVRPLRPGKQTDETRARVQTALPPELDKMLPAGELVLQTFQDQKTVREGYGDILFVPAERAELDDAAEKELAPLLAILDPELVGTEAKAAPADDEADSNPEQDAPEGTP